MRPIAGDSEHDGPQERIRPIRSQGGSDPTDHRRLHVLLTTRVAAGLSRRMTLRSRIIRTLVAVTGAEVAGERRRSKTESHSEQSHHDFPHCSPPPFTGAFGVPSLARERMGMPGVAQTRAAEEVTASNAKLWKKYSEPSLHKRGWTDSTPDLLAQRATPGFQQLDFPPRVRTAGRADFAQELLADTDE